MLLDRLCPICGMDIDHNTIEPHFQNVHLEFYREIFLLLNIEKRWWLELKRLMEEMVPIIQKHKLLHKESCA